MSLSAAGSWLLHSGIQEPCGGFARWYDAEARKNKPVSTEISGYAASALVWLFRVTGDEVYLDAAKRTAAFLVSVWDEELQLFPFEWPSRSAYFFDTGIVTRGLLAVWRESRDELLLKLALTAAQGMIANFRAENDFHPILTLPEKAPLPRARKWSRSAGCYQLKAAMAWWDVAEITGNAALREEYLAVVEHAVSKHSCFLHEAADRYDAMDRLHAYAYFLEGLLPMIEGPVYRRVFDDGLSAMRRLLVEVEPAFVRSDVYAQLLRAGLFAGVTLPVAEKLAAYQASSDDPRIDGGFYFGWRDGRISPQVNPVSTVFAMQALHMQTDGKVPCRKMLI